MFFFNLVRNTTFFVALGLPLAYSAAAYAAPVTFFNTIPDGRNYFDTQVNDASGALYTEALSGLANQVNSWTLDDFTITATNGDPRDVDSSVLNPAPTGLPGGDAINMTADGSTASGLTFTFDNAINGFGIELDDWATCCYPSSLYISFNGGTPILIGTAANGNDNPGTAASQGAKTFIGAIDDSGTFTTITFYGTGNGDVLNAGGIIRYAFVPLGSISGGYTQVVAGTPSSGHADYLDQYDDSGVLQVVANYLNNASSEEVAQALKTIIPVNTSVTSQTMLSSSGQTSNVLIEKVGTVLGNLSPVSGLGFNGGHVALGLNEGLNPFEGGVNGADPVAMLSSSPYKKFQVDNHAMWLQGVAAGANGSSTSSTMGYDTFSRGVVGGYEFIPHENMLIGVLASAFRSDIDVDNDAGKTKAGNYNVGLYGQKIYGATKLTGIASFGYGDFESERRIDVGGVTAAPEADYNGYSGSLALGLSRLYEHNNYKIEPFVMTSYTAVKTEGYTEEGGGAFNMDVSDDRFSTASVRMGVTVQHDTKLAEKNLALKIKPYVSQQWELEKADNDVRFVGAGSATTVTGRDLTVFETGIAGEVNYSLSDSSSLKIGADLSRDKYEQRYITYVGVGFKF